LSSSRLREVFCLILIVLFSALFRYAVFGGRSFPSGDDEAMSSGFIFLILSNGHIPSVNIHHMPGTPYTYPPNFHLLCTLLVFVTSIPILDSTLILGLLTNTLTVLPFYSLSKEVLGKRNTALVASLLFAASTSDMYMLTWGGYVNLMALFFIPMIFWLSLRGRTLGPQSWVPGGLLVGALLLTHHFSAFVLVVLALACTIISAARYLREGGETWRRFISSLGGMMIIGGCLASGWWLSKITLYMTILAGPAERAEAAVTWITIVSHSIRALTGIAAAMFFISWFAFLGIYRLKKQGDGLGPEETIIFLWILIPILLAIPYLVGPSPAFQRFLYYIIQPALILMTLGLVTTVSAIKGIRLGEVRVAGLFFVGFLVASYLIGTLAFANGNYQFFLSMNEEREDTIRWLRDYSGEREIVVTEHSFGWWIAGTGHRPTLSASPAPYLSYPYEEPLARDASLILSANYGIENGVLRVDEAGPYGPHNNPKIAFIRQGLYHQMLSVHDSEIVVLTASGSRAEAITLDKPSYREAVWIKRDEEETILRVTLEDAGVKLTRSISLSRGSRTTTLSYELVARPGFRILGMNMLLRFSGLNQTFQDERSVGGLNLLQQRTAEAVFASPGVSHLSIALQVGVQDIEGVSRSEGEKRTKTLGRMGGEERGESIGTPVKAETSWQAIRERSVRYIVTQEIDAEKFQSDRHFLLTYCNGKIFVFLADY